MSSASPGQLPPEEQQEMPLIEHLLELRNRLLKMVLAVLVCFAVLFPFRNELYLILAGPLMELLPVGQSMIATDITDERNRLFASSRSGHSAPVYPRHLPRTLD